MLLVIHLLHVHLPLDLEQCFKKLTIKMDCELTFQQ